MLRLYTQENTQRKTREENSTKKRILARILTVVVAISLAISLSPSQAYGNGIDVSYWYSDSNEVGYWSTSQVDVYVSTSVSASVMSVAKIKGCLNTAFLRWSFTGVRKNYVSSPGSAQMSVSAITSSRANDLGLPSHTAGATFCSGPWAGRVYYNGMHTKNVYRINHADIYLIYSPLNPTGSSAGALKVTVHELGHALGYLGHYSSGNVMTAFYENMRSTFPSFNEERHLRQIYALY